MQKSLFFLLSFLPFMTAFGQEPAAEINFVFLDAAGNLITPDIWVQSKTVDQDELQVTTSPQVSLLVDSLAKHASSGIWLQDKTYIIYSLTGGHWLDTEYTIRLRFNDQNMTLHFTTTGSSFSDTLVFSAGDYVYLGNNLPDPQVPIRKIPTLGKLIEIKPAGDVPLCLLNCSGEIRPLEPDLEAVILKTTSYFPQFLSVNGKPLGILIWRDEHLYRCFFSDAYLEILRDKFY